MHRLRHAWLVLWLLAGAAAAEPAPHKHHKKTSSHRVHHSLMVTATAYNSTKSQTDGEPFTGAWGDRLDQLPPGQRAIAVSPDLLTQGIHRHQHLHVHGFKGDWVVLDKTPARWHNRIDLYMGEDVKAAHEYGRRCCVKISWSTRAPRSKPSEPQSR